MKTYFLCLVAGAAILAVAAPGAPAASAQATATLDLSAIEDEGVPLTPAETLILYQDKTWKWESGGGYFSPVERQFFAYTDQEDDVSFADGRWVILHSGALCIRATWHQSDTEYPKEDCFGHRKIRDTIYQRRLPEGEWYVFRTSDDDIQSEYTKFEDGDLVSARKDEIEGTLNTSN